MAGPRNGGAAGLVLAATWSLLLSDPLAALEYPVGCRAAPDADTGDGTREAAPRAFPPDAVVLASGGRALSLVLVRRPARTTPTGGPSPWTRARAWWRTIHNRQSGAPSGTPEQHHRRAGDGQARLRGVRVARPGHGP